MFQDVSRKREQYNRSVLDNPKNIWHTYRQAHKAYIDEKNREERFRLEEQQKRTEDLLARKKEGESKNACELLGNLNESNRTLIQEMFEVQTPNCKIRYQDIEALFGETTDGKLPGTITSVSGSHRKICIQNTVGFFDEFYVAEANTTESVNKTPAASEFESKTKSDVVVGGMFKPHKNGQGGGKLPRVAIRMVCDTLERVGITAENIALFNKAAFQKPKFKLG